MQCREEVWDITNREKLFPAEKLICLNNLTIESEDEKQAYQQGGVQPLLIWKDVGLFAKILKICY